MINLTESDLKGMNDKRLTNLARSLKVITMQQPDGTKSQFEDYSRLVHSIAIEKSLGTNDKKKGSGEGQGDENHIISKENLALREALTELKIDFLEEHFLEDVLYKPDFYIP